MRPPRFVAVAAAATLGLSIASAIATASADQPRNGPERILRVGATAFPDYLDPQLSYTQEGWTAMYDTYVPLLTYRHAGGEEASKIAPGLATHLPRITDGGKTYTLFLHDGLKYASGETVKASDFRFAIERLIKINSPGAYFYEVIVGAREFRQGKRRRIAGIATNNGSGRITIRLTRRDGTFSSKLTMLFAAPLAPSTPIRNQTRNPPSATGPYMITSSKPGLGWEYGRNPAWENNSNRLTPHIPGGEASRIKVRVIGDWSALEKRVERGTIDWSLSPPPPKRYAALKRRLGKSRFREHPYLATYYFWMNTRRAPFSDVRVRRAVNYAVDRAVVRHLYGGSFSPTEQILPPGMPGYKKFKSYPHNMSKARRLIAKASPSDRTITVWTIGEEPHRRVAAYYRRVLQRLGFDARLRTIGGFDYFEAIGRSRRPDLDTGWSNWFADFLHPANFFEPTLSGASISSVYNLNLAQIDVSSLNRRILRLSQIPGPIPGGRYAALDRSFMKQAPWVPLGNPTASTYSSKAVNLGKALYNPAFGYDLTSIRFR